MLLDWNLLNVVVVRGIEMGAYAIKDRSAHVYESTRFQQPNDDLDRPSGTSEVGGQDEHLSGCASAHTRTVGK